MLKNIPQGKLESRLPMKLRILFLRLFLSGLTFFRATGPSHSCAVLN